MLSVDDLVHTATVEIYAGAGATGAVYGDPIEVPCYYEGRRQMVRDSSGEEAVSEGTMFVDPIDLPVDSRVTVLGRTTYVLSVATYDDGHSGLAHIEVALA